MKCIEPLLGQGSSITPTSILPSFHSPNLPRVIAPIRGHPRLTAGNRASKLSPCAPPASNIPIFHSSNIPFHPFLHQPRQKIPIHALHKFAKIYAKRGWEFFAGADGGKDGMECWKSGRLECWMLAERTAKASKRGYPRLAAGARG